MRQDVQTSLVVDFEELFSLRDRLRQVADGARARLLQAGLEEPLETEVFDDEMEMRGPEGSSLLVRLDSYHLEITGAPPTLHTHVMAGHILDESGVYRLQSVEVAYEQTIGLPAGLPISMVAQAFGPLDATAPMLDRRFSMTWEWGDATTGYSVLVTSTEDQQLNVGFKAREAYMTLPELHSGVWMRLQQERCEAVISKLAQQFGWQ